ncbi:MAG TPA: amidohydrolase family protein [Devosiaceae bacterium]
MTIVDAQIHIWGPNTPARPWLSEAWKNHSAGAFDAPMVLAAMDAAGVDRAVLVPPSWEGGRNDLALAAAVAHPDRLSVFGRLQLQQPDDPRLLDKWQTQPGMLGLRYTFTTDDAIAALEDGAVDWLWQAAERADIPLMVLPLPHLVPRFGAIADRHPGLRLIIDHLGRLTTGRKDDAAFADLPELLALARRPNVAVKASALPTYSTQAYPFGGLHPYIRQVYDAFGPRRMFWGSDLTRLNCSYRECIELFTEALPWLTAEDQRLIMGEALCSWIGWAVPSTADT